MNSKTSPQKPAPAAKPAKVSKSLIPKAAAKPAKVSKSLIPKAATPASKAATVSWYSAKLRNARIPPRKARLVAELIRGKNVALALGILDNVAKRSSPAMKDLLKSAIANAEQRSDGNANLAELKVRRIFVDQGRTLKRWRARAYGRAAPIRKRSCHITLMVG